MGAQEAEKNYNVPVVASSFEQVNDGEEMWTWIDMWIF